MTDEQTTAKSADEELPEEMRPKVGVLLGSILLVALCSIIYELIIGTLSSYLLGNSVYQFSIVIGLYMSAMGVGSYLSRFVRSHLLEGFFLVEIGVGLLGGTSASLLFGIFAFTPYFQIAIWVVTFAIGVLVGLEIPLLTRYVRNFSQLRVAIANVLSWDYIGALLGSLAFPLFLLPTLGILNTAAVVGLVNIVVALGGLWIFRKQVVYGRLIAGLAVAVACLLTFLFFSSGAYERFLDRKLFTDSVVYREQTPYQKLTMTAWQDDYRLFINGNIQFSSRDEYRYHEALVLPAMKLHGAPRRVAILGGGDGLAVRQVMKFPTVEEIVMIDLDPRMTELARTHPLLSRLNDRAMEEEVLTVVHADAMQYLIDNPKETFDVVIIDLPDPNNESLAKLYSVEFYRLLRTHLNPGGMAVAQSSSAYYSPRAFWSIHRSMERGFCGENECDSRVVPYHVWVPSFGDWGFNLVSRDMPISGEALSFDELDVEFLTNETFAAALNFPPDIGELDVKPNRLIEPILLHYYTRDWKHNHL